MSDQNPKSLTPSDWDEVARVREVRESWGLQPDDHGLALASFAYGAKFDFVSGSPGYVGELFVIVGDGLSAAPFTLIRDKKTRRLALADY